jgi:hypothetical protein
MKYNKIGFTITLLFLSTAIYSQGFNVPDFSEDKIGTYMPILFINELIKTNNYLEAMLINNDRYYDVICIKKNIVYSNLKFHDQFAIMPNDVKLFTFSVNKDVTELTDKNGYKYIKISKDLDYYIAYELYVNNHFFNLLNKFRQNIIVKTDNGFIFNEKRWRINLDVLNYPKDDNFMYFNEKRNGEYIGIQYINNEIRVYNLEPDNDNFLAQKNKNILLTIK